MTPNDFADFRDRVWSDVSLQCQLLAQCDRADFLEKVVELGHQCGYQFSRAEAERELNLNLRAWFERGIR